MLYIIFGILAVIAVLLTIAVIRTLMIKAPAIGECKTEISEAERRPLAQLPDISTGTILSGKFMTGFETFTLDQFPLRDTFRSLKSFASFYIFRNKDNNNIYIEDGYAAQLEYSATSMPSTVWIWRTLQC